MTMFYFVSDVSNADGHPEERGKRVQKLTAKCHQQSRKYSSILAKQILPIPIVYNLTVLNMKNTDMSYRSIPNSKICFGSHDRFVINNFIVII